MVNDRREVEEEDRRTCACDKSEAGRTVEV